MSGFRLRQVVIGLGALAAVAGVVVMVWAMTGGEEAWPSALSALLHLALAVVIPATGAALVARSAPGAGERAGLLVLAANGGFQLVTVTFFVATGAGVAPLVSPDGASALLAVLAGLAAAARLASLRPWLVEGVVRHPARFLAAAGVAVLAAVDVVLVVLHVLGVGDWAQNVTVWPSTLVLLLVTAAVVVVILRAPEAASAAAVAAVFAGYVMVGLVGTVWWWLDPPADIVAIPPDFRTVGEAAALLLLLIGATWLLTHPDGAAHLEQPVRR